MQLEHLTVYGLKNSFATHCRESGMKAEALTELMVHTKYETTQKYYIHVSKKRKVDALMKIQEKERNRFKKLKKDFSNNSIDINKNDKIKSTFLSALTL